MSGKSFRGDQTYTYEYKFNFDAIERAHDKGVNWIEVGGRRIYSAEPAPIPEGAMRVAPGTDAIVWRIHPKHSGEL